MNIQHKQTSGFPGSFSKADNVGIEGDHPDNATMVLQSHCVGLVQVFERVYSPQCNRHLKVFFCFLIQPLPFSDKGLYTPLSTRRGKSPS